MTPSTDHEVITRTSKKRFLRHNREGTFAWQKGLPAPAAGSERARTNTTSCQTKQPRWLWRQVVLAPVLGVWQRKDLSPRCAIVGHAAVERREWAECELRVRKTRMHAVFIALSTMQEQKTHRRKIQQYKEISCNSLQHFLALII